MYLLFSSSVKPFAATAVAQGAYPGGTAVAETYGNAAGPPGAPPAWEGRSIGTQKLRLVEFQAFLEQQRDADNVSGYHGYMGI